MASERTGLAAEVPTREWSIKLDAVPELREAFQESALVWGEDVDGNPCLYRAHDFTAIEASKMLSAPTRGELLELLINTGRVFNTAHCHGPSRSAPYRLELILYDPDMTITGNGYDITDPDELAQACLATTGNK